MYKPPHRRGPPGGASSVPSSTAASVSTSAPPSSPPNNTPLNMEHLASVSRSGGYGDSGDALKDHAVQERYFAYIASVGV